MVAKGKKKGPTWEENSREKKLTSLGERSTIRNLYRARKRTTEKMEWGDDFVKNVKGPIFEIQRLPRKPNPLFG